MTPRPLPSRAARWSMLGRDIAAIADDLSAGRLDLDAATAAVRMLAAREAAALDGGDIQADGQTFVLTLRHAGEGCAIRAMRAALKRLWRDHGLRCVRITEQQEARV